MTEEELGRLRKMLNVSYGAETGSGMWNVHQRLIHQYGEGSGLVLEMGRERGLRVILQWNNSELFGS